MKQQERRKPWQSKSLRCFAAPGLLPCVAPFAEIYLKGKGCAFQVIYVIGSIVLWPLSSLRFLLCASPEYIRGLRTSKRRLRKSLRSLHRSTYSISFLMKIISETARCKIRM